MSFMSFISFKRMQVTQFIKTFFEKKSHKRRINTFHAVHDSRLCSIIFFDKIFF